MLGNTKKSAYLCSAGLCLKGGFVQRSSLPFFTEKLFKALIICIIAKKEAMARWTRLNSETFEAICKDVIEHNKSFNKAIADAGSTRTTFYKYLINNEEAQAIYKYAREIRCDTLFEEIIDIADTPEMGIVIKTDGTRTETREGDMTDHRRLKIDARKWVVARMMPQKYGDRIDVTSNGTNIAALPPISIAIEGQVLDLSIDKTSEKEAENED